MVKTILLSTVLALAVSGCATNRRPVEAASAQSLVNQAEQAGAQQFAAADLEAARNKLQQADDPRTDHDVAVRLATEAAIDAQVASARTQAAKAEQSLAQVNAGSETLRQETTNQAQESTPQPQPLSTQPPDSTNQPQQP